MTASIIYMELSSNILIIVLRACPICRVVIFHVVRAPVFYEHQTINKQKLLVGYLRRQK